MAAYKSELQKRQAAKIRSFASSICGSKVISLIVFIPFVKTTFFDYFSILSQFANAMLLVETVLFALLFLACNYHSKLLAFLIVYYVWDLIIAPIFGHNDAPSIYYCLQALGFSLYVLLGMKSNKVKSLDSLSFAFCFVAVLNYALVLSYPNGIIATTNGNLWLFGIRTGFSLVLIPGIFFCLLFDSCSCRGNFSVRSWLMILVAVLTLTNQWVATGLVELCIILALFLWARFVGSINIGIASIAIGILTIFILFTGPSSVFGDVVNSLGKDMTISGRTDIWAAVIAAISLSPYFGYGSVSSVLVHNEYWACHDLWLNIGHESGIIGLLLYIPAFAYSAHCLNKVRKLCAGSLAGIFFLAILVASIAEIQTYFPFIYGVLACSEAIAANPKGYEKSTFPVPMKIR